MEEAQLTQQTQQVPQIKREVTPILGEIEGTGHRLYNWNGYGVVLGPGKTPFVFFSIEERRKSIKQNMILIVGQPGTGKSYCALRLAQIFDPHFNPHLQVVFERSHLLWLLGPNSPLKMGQVIVIDEAQFVAGARRWYEEIQKDVMEHIEAVRSRGFIIIIVALHLSLLDKIIRQYVLSHMVLMRDRGKAVFYELFTPPFEDKLYKRRLGSVRLQLPDFEYCAYPNCLLCQYLNNCMTIRAIYERLKREFLMRMSIQAQRKAALKEGKYRLLDFNEIFKYILASRGELTYTSKGTVEPESVRIILEKHGILLRDTELNRVIKRGKILYPDVFTMPVIKG